MNKKLTAAVLALSVVFSAAVFSGCSLFGDDEEDTVESENLKRQMNIEDNDFENPKYDVEDDGAEPVYVKHDKEDFVGNWVATSNRAEYSWGNVNLKIMEGGKWKGNITEEDMHGKWTPYGKGVLLKDSDELINWTLYFTAEGTLVFEDNEDPGDAIVLEKGPRS